MSVRARSNLFPPWRKMRAFPECGLAEAGRSSGVFRRPCSRPSRCLRRASQGSPARRDPPAPTAGRNREPRLSTQQRSLAAWALRPAPPQPQAKARFRARAASRFAFVRRRCRHGQHLSVSANQERRSEAKAQIDGAFEQPGAPDLRRRLAVPKNDMAAEWPLYEKPQGFDASKHPSEGLLVVRFGSRRSAMRTAGSSEDGSCAVPQRIHHCRFAPNAPTIPLCSTVPAASAWSGP